MKQTPTFVIVSWQRSEHGYSSLRYETCLVSCHRLMRTVRAWLFIPKVWNMLGQLSSPHENGQSMVIHPLSMKHAPSVVIASWQRSEHGYSSLRYETSSVSCHRLMTTVRAWFFIPKVWNMLHLLSSSSDNGQSMVIYHLCMKLAPTVVIVSWQWREQVRNMHRQLWSFRDDGQSMVIPHSGKKHAPSIMIISWPCSEHGYTPIS